MRAVAKANPFQPRYAMRLASPSDWMKPATGGEEAEDATAGTSGVRGDGAYGKMRQEPGRPGREVGGAQSTARRNK